MNGRMSFTIAKSDMRRPLFIERAFLAAPHHFHTSRSTDTNSAALRYA